MGKKATAIIGAETKQAEDGFKRLNDIFKSQRTLILGAASAMQLYFVAGTAKLAAENQAVERSFKNIVEGEGKNYIKFLGDLRKASLGTISDAELMKKANQAAMLGLDLGGMAKLLQIARSAAQATGETVEFMFNSIVVGLGRQSKLILDNLGILVDAETANNKYAASLGKLASQLTEAERKQAFINEALEKGMTNVGKAGGLVETSADKFSQFSAAWENFKNAMGTLALPLVQKGLEAATNLMTTASNAESIRAAVKSWEAEGGKGRPTETFLTSFVEKFNREFSGFFAALTRTAFGKGQQGTYLDWNLSPEFAGAQDLANRPLGQLGVFKRNYSYLGNRPGISRPENWDEMMATLPQPPAAPPMPMPPVGDLLGYEFKGGQLFEEYGVQMEELLAEPFEKHIIPTFQEFKNTLDNIRSPLADWQDIFTNTMWQTFDRVKSMTFDFSDVFVSTIDAMINEIMQNAINRAGGMLGNLVGGFLLNLSPIKALQTVFSPKQAALQ